MAILRYAHEGLLHKRYLFWGWTVPLKLFHRILHLRTSPTHDETMIWAAISIAVFGFLRIGEMTCSGPYNSSTNLCRSDVSFHNKKRGDNEVFLQLRIKASKIHFEPPPQ